MPLALLAGIPSGVVTGLTTTNVIPLPVNCIMAKDALYKLIVEESERVPFRIKESTKASGSGGRLSKESSSFTTRTSSRGYD